MYIYVYIYIYIYIYIYVYTHNPIEYIPHIRIHRRKTISINYRLHEIIQTAR